jgi:hypothetical protein
MHLEYVIVGVPIKSVHWQSCSFGLAGGCRGRSEKKLE